MDPSSRDREIAEAFAEDVITLVYDAWGEFRPTEAVTEAVMEFLAAARPVQQWVSVTVDQPAKSGWYLVVQNFFSLGIHTKRAWFDKPSESWDDSGFGVTHWMPLPAPPADSPQDEKEK